jgi:hypothetical protein
MKGDGRIFRPIFGPLREWVRWLIGMTRFATEISELIASGNRERTERQIYGFFIAAERGQYVGYGFPFWLYPALRAMAFYLVEGDAAKRRIA